MKILIIGNGPAAVSAVEAIRAADRASSITMVAREAGPAYAPSFLSRYLAGEIGKERLLMRDEDFYENNDARTLFGIAATEVLTGDNRVRLADGSELPYDALLIAAGSNPFMPNVPGIEGEGVFNFKTLSDADLLGARLRKVKEAVVAGVGFVSLEVAEALRQRGVNVTLIGRRNGILLRMLDEEVAGMMARHVEGRGVRFMGGRVLQSVKRDERGILRGVLLDSGEALPCDLLVMALGVSPNLGMVANTPIRTGSGIIVDHRMRTSVSNVFAAGDIAELETGGIRKINPIHSNAVKGGWIAGCNITGQARSFESHLEDMNVLTLFGMPVLSIGEQKGDMVLKRKDGGRLVKVYADTEGRLRGVQLLGDVTKGGLYLSILRRGLQLNGRFDIMDPGLNYGQTMKIPGM